jgi:hypothetical protein
MALHRDIHWIGRQWAVTGYGMQAIDRKVAGEFDVEIARLWDDGLPESFREQKWFNAEDFNRGLAIARARYPQPPRQLALPLSEESVLPAMASGLMEPSQQAVEPEKDEIPSVDAVEPTEPAAQQFVMRIKGWPAKFVRPWRVRIRR